MIKRKCAIVGLGKVGTAASLLFVTSGLFDEVVLCARNEDQSWAEALDLSHAAALMQSKCVVSSAPAGKVAQCEIIVLALGVPQKAVLGGDRTSGITLAAEMIEGAMRQLAPNNPDAVYIILTNPVEAMVYAAVRATGLPARQVVSTGTVLDSARLQNAIGSLLSISARDVHAMVLGEHGKTAFPLMSAASASGMPLADMLSEEDAMVIKATMLEVRKEPFLVARHKGGTSSAVAMTALRVAEAVVTDSNALLPVSVIPDLDGLRDVCVNLPSIVGRGGVKRTVMPTMTGAEQADFETSLAALRAAITLLSDRP